MISIVLKSWKKVLEGVQAAVSQHIVHFDRHIEYV